MPKQTCKKCGEEFYGDSDICPKCGPTDRLPMWIYAITGIGIIVLVYAAMVTKSPAQYWPNGGPRGDMPIPMPPNCTKNFSGNWTCCDERGCWTVRR